MSVIHTARRVAFKTRVLLERCAQYDIIIIHNNIETEEQKLLFIAHARCAVTHMRSYLLRVQALIVYNTMYALGTYATEVQYIVLYIRNNHATIFGVQRVYSLTRDLYMGALKKIKKKKKITLATNPIYHTPEIN